MKLLSKINQVYGMAGHNTCRFGTQARRAQFDRCKTMIYSFANFLSAEIAFGAD